MPLALDLPEAPSLAIAGSADRFPVRRIFCVGRNYAEHIREMGGDPDREAPFFFMKPADALVENGATIPFPPATRDLHHEIELVLALSGGGQNVAAGDAKPARTAPSSCELSGGGQNVAAGDALDLIHGYAVGIDLTRRDLQGQAKKASRPWEAGKAFENSAPCTAIHRAGDRGHPKAGRIWLAVNGETRQDGDLAQMIWAVPEILAALSKLFTLKAGDLIFTGTPAGVAALRPGDRVTGGVEGLSELSLTLAG